MEKCISCGRKGSDIVKFPCPKCKKEITRCFRCRNLSIDYTCECGYVGP